MRFLVAVAFSCYEQTQAVFDEYSSMLILKGVQAVELNAVDAQACKLFIGLSVIAQVYVGDIVFKSVYQPYSETALYFELTTNQALGSISTYSIAVFTISTQAQDIFYQQAVNSFRIRKFDYNSCVTGLQLVYDNAASTIEVLKTGFKCSMLMTQQLEISLVLYYGTNVYDLGMQTMILQDFLDNPFVLTNQAVAINTFYQFDYYDVNFIMKADYTFTKQYSGLYFDLQPLQEQHTLSMKKEVVQNITIIQQKQQIARLKSARIGINYDNIRVTVQLTNEPLTEFSQPFDNFVIDLCLYLDNESVCFYNSYSSVQIASDIVFACAIENCVSTLLSLKQFGTQPKLKFVTYKNGEIVYYYHIIPEITQICTNYIQLTVYRDKLCIDFEFISGCHIEQKITVIAVAAGDKYISNKFMYPPENSSQICRTLNAAELATVYNASKLSLYIDGRIQDIDNTHMFVQDAFLWQATAYSAALGSCVLIASEIIICRCKKGKKAPKKSKKQASSR